MLHNFRFRMYPGTPPDPSLGVLDPISNIFILIPKSPSCRKTVPYCQISYLYREVWPVCRVIFFFNVLNHNYSSFSKRWGILFKDIIPCESFLKRICERCLKEFVPSMTAGAKKLCSWPAKCKMRAKGGTHQLVLFHAIRLLLLLANKSQTRKTKQERSHSVLFRLYWYRYFQQD